MTRDRDNAADCGSSVGSSEPSLDPSAEGDWDDWEAEEGDNQPTKCLFQDQVAPSPQEALALDREAHGVDVLEIVQSMRLSFYGAMKLINYIRAHVAQGLSPAAVLDKARSEQLLFRNDEEGDTYLQPVISEDPLLYALTNLMEERGLTLAGEDFGEEEGGAARAPAVVANGEAVEGEAELPDAVALEAENRALREEVAVLRARVARMGELMVEMDKDTVVPKPSLKEPDNDTYYFTSYAHYAIHETMLRDHVRTSSYQRAIEMAGPTAIHGKVVLDIGCGTGVLSMFAARAGARQVVSVDCSDIIHQATKIVKDNGFESVITLVKGKMEEVSLPVSHVDVIVSEWMGYCLLYESMLPSVLHARDRYLAPGGVLMPNRCTMFLQGMSDKEGRLSWWKDVYGLDMSAMRRFVTGEPAIEVLPSNAIVTDKCLIKDLDLMTIRDSDLDYETPFSVRATEDGVSLNGLVVHFDTHFDCPAGSVVFSTGADVEPTHWRQALFWLSDGPTAPLTIGDEVAGSYKMTRNRDNPREYDVAIRWEVRSVDGGSVLASGAQSYLIGS